MEVKRFPGFLLLFFLVPFLLQIPARAVPAWARKTGLACSACHFGGSSRLNRMGREFQIRGHRLSADASDAAQKPRLTDYVSLSTKLRATITEEDSSLHAQALALYAGGPLSRQLSAFFQYDLYDRGASAKSQPGEAYMQYNTRPGGDSYGWLRAGRLYPYLIYSASGGGRVPLSRPRVIEQPLGGGNQYAPRSKQEGVSTGYVGGNGLWTEVGIVSGSGLTALSDVFATVEKHLDPFGSGVGIYGYAGRSTIAAAPPLPAWQDRFAQWGLLGQYQRENVQISGAVFRSTARRFGGEDRRHPTGFYAEAACNINPGLTGFVRYDDKDDDLAGVRKTTGAVAGLTYRLPNQGRAVIEWGGTRTAAGYREQIIFEANWLY